MAEMFMILFLYGFLFLRRTAHPSAFTGGCLVGFLAAARTSLFSAAGHFVNGRPRAALGFFAAEAARLVAFLDEFGLAFLFAGVTGFITLRHILNLMETIQPK